MRLAKGTFLRSVATLATGAVIAQALNLAITPVLSRLYTPEDFGVLGLLGSFVTLFVGISSYRYDMAVVLPEDRADASSLLQLSLGLAALTSLLVLAAVSVAADPVAMLFGAPGLGSWLWLAPILIFAAGSFNVLNYWCTRNKAFGRQSVASVVATSSSAAAKLSAGWAQLGAIGLVGGQILGQSVATLALYVQVRRDPALDRDPVDWDRIRAMAKKYREFPIFHAPMTLVNSLTQNLPVYALGAYFDTGVVGQWSLTLVLLGAPVRIVSNSVRQVLLQRLSEERNRSGDVAGLFWKATFGLFAVGALPAALGAWLSPWAFQVVLGDEWAMAGNFARYAMLWQLTVLAASPAVALFPVLRMQRYVLGSQILTTGVTLGVLWWGGRTRDPELMVLLYSMGMALMMVVLIGLVGWGARRDQLESEVES